MHVTFNSNEKLLATFDLDKPSLAPRPIQGRHTRLPRTTAVKIELPDRIRVDYVAARRDGRSLRVVADGKQITPKATTVENFYTRQSRPKLLNRCFLRDATPPYEIHWILQRYTTFFAIDTNTQVQNGQRVSVSIAIQGVFKHLHDDQMMLGSCPPIGVRAVDVPDSPEVAGWVSLIRTLQRNPYFATNRYALIVDADLGKLASYNERTLPLLDDFYLPPNIDLIFATSDSGAEEFFLNAMLRRCDNAARRALLGSFRSGNPMSR